MEAEPPAVTRDLDNPWSGDHPYWDLDLRSWFWLELWMREQRNGN